MNLATRRAPNKTPASGEAVDLEGPEADDRMTGKRGSGCFLGYRVSPLLTTCAGFILGLAFHGVIKGNENESPEKPCGWTPCAPCATTEKPPPRQAAQKPPAGGWNYPMCYMNDYRPQDYTKYGGTPLMDALRYTAGNVGNMVWMHGASVLLNQQRPNPYILPSWLDDDRLTTYGFKTLYFPVANIFTNISVCGRPGTTIVRGSPEWAIERTAFAVKSVNGPTLLVGAGTNGFFAPTERPRLIHDLQPGKVSTPTSTYTLCGVHMELLNAVAERDGYVLSRGNFTTQVLRAHGFKRVFSTGCPSLFSDPRPALGRRLEERLAFLKKQLASGMNPNSVKVAVNLPPYFVPKMIGLLLKILLDNPLNRLIIQDERDENTLVQCKQALKIEVPEDRKIYFTSVAAWEEYMTQFDFFLGGRIHGSMTGLQKGVPGFLIAPDMRVYEMAQIMKVPFTDIYDDRLRSPAGVTIADFVSMTSIDGAAFDRNRCVLYRHYEYVFRELRIEINPDLAQVCDELDVPEFHGSYGEFN